MAEPATVGVTEVRRNVSRYLRRAAAGEPIMITIHGQPVAILVPIGAGTGAP